MVKIHTRAKRKHSSTTHISTIKHPSRNRKTRPRTFKSEESAKAWADKNGIKEYELQNLRFGDSKDKKIRVNAL
jgi:hypothetical protein